ncbi:YjbH domain-containing protein, partial [Christiangramia aquimixticola]|uniref:YjbH domain-containing protein n=1 Tax=Christiangramia aquimixticola TaxID=1697558 RepID=UPI003AA8C6F7
KLMCSRIILFFLLCLLSHSSLSQVNIMGKPGYINTPTAGWFEDRPVGLTFAFMPGDYSQFKNELTDVYFYNLRGSFTSFFEVNFTIAHRPVRAKLNNLGIGDRHLDIRFRLLKETETRPGIVLGLTPPGSAAPYLSHDYLVLTKRISIGSGVMELTSGYGSPFVFIKRPNANSIFDYSIERKSTTNLKADYLTGFFAGFSYSPIQFGGLMLEFDSNTINGGVYLRPWQWLNLQAYTYEGKDWGLNAAFNMSLDFPPKSLRKYAKTMD